ncbi:hypothetical protein DS884_11095 [Tenacibaculum sp. E3R01]|uniref:hypothetical protein n=1 Tax=Tenacibaculum sp. E3R01 TaxID=2267227 RepID=UPI000DE830B9|nr:hypothetical protein [Tenacibaculum sp. E3R01]RBW57124.1 hypothetical protein DS884_11095 [Tenacibaculum sp. E3R01]
MKKIILIFLLNSIISFSQTESENTEIENLYNEFNLTLNKYYPSEKLGTSYKLFLNDLDKKKVNPQIIREKNIVEAFSKIKNSTTFYKIWKKNNVNSARNNSINYESEFYKKLVNDCEDEYSKKLLKETGNTVILIPDLNPFVIVGTYVDNFKDENYNNESVQKAICLTIYYDIVEEFTK